ncbi:MAG: hypothetical protein A2Y57_03550 [Candidatus Woykebacteria bacterium RBG_13_40_7b]|uniref:PsbP C-terminal domain-containing protein n=1 Tax=Candidatus Woykebacteria bacterium RBG_13_40_7b TaxID=1802594 RepID=A0A1G1W870_9BACT|nr:MAG: hypothetical protein A2Y57_03550 [Candidatus Woykebacteria bacterium RBG_13_40_7b]
MSPSDSPEICDPNQAFFAPTKEILGACATEFGGIINISLTTSTIDQMISSYAEEDYDNFKKEELGIINNKKTVKISGISKVKTEFFDLTGTKTIVYLVDFGDKTLHVMYSQKPTWSDYSATFEKMFSTLKFLN